MPLASIELGERTLAATLVGWRQALDTDEAQSYAALTDALSVCMGHARGIAIADWLESPAELREHALAMIARAHDLPSALLNEAHTLGWAHQHLVSEARAQSFAAHHS
ncbi:MAG: hypothetical protein H0U74_07265, partial [Bradymonadaceae bacterium]|nr:hypothetical protein [Lujinxingiaceae bacterium]